MKIQYTHRFAVKCPHNKRIIHYTLTLETDKMIHVEKIVIACQLWQEEYHEKIAEHLVRQFPGTRQTLDAHHHGVDIRTVAE